MNYLMGYLSGWAVEASPRSPTPSPTGYANGFLITKIEVFNNMVEKQKLKHEREKKKLNIPKRKVSKLLLGMYS